MMGVHGGQIKSPKVLADIVQSVVAAVYVDCGFDLQSMWLVIRELLEPIVMLNVLEKQPQPITSLQRCLRYVRRMGRNLKLSIGGKIVKTVYASPTRANFHLDSRKEVETKPAYPDICFAVDDFDSTFDVVVLTDTTHCYFVLLYAVGGAAFPSEKSSQDI